MNRQLIIAFIMLLSVLSPIVCAEDGVDDNEVEGMTVRGNRELPKVLYILPWKRLDSIDTQQELVLHSLYGDMFDPVDPVSFARFVDYYADQGTKGGRE